MQWELDGLMEDCVIEPEHGQWVDKFSTEFLRKNLIECASVGQLRRIVGSLQHKADVRSDIFCYPERLGLSFSDEEKREFIHDLALQTLVVEVCEEELSRRRRTVRPFMRSPSNAWGEVTSCTRWRSM